MTKDFSTLSNEGICSREEALRAYCTSQSVFFPPHPQYVVDSMVEGFKKYWEGNSSLKELAEACYLREVNGLYQYFAQWLNGEDLVE